MSFNLKYKSYGERAILIEWPNKIEESILHDILKFKSKIQRADNKAILELKSAYNTLLVVFHDPFYHVETHLSWLERIYKSKLEESEVNPVIWTIPVCYDTSFGIDLEAISKAKNIKVSELIKRHSQAIYTVYFIGFLPGFLYLGGLEKSLYVPRKSTPRMKIEKGAVAIGGSQTGVYPIESPGGWNIIGNTPINFFNPLKERPCFAQAGDRIVFKPVSLQEYNDIKILVDAGVYQIKNEKNNHD